LGPKIITHLRPAELYDIPHCVCLGEMEYEQIFHTTDGFSIDYCESFIFHSLGRGDRFNYVLVEESDIPFGYITGGLENLFMTQKPDAVIYHWFVNNHDGQYGRKNFGKMLIKAFEMWAENKGVNSVNVGYIQKPGKEKYLNRAFRKMGYELNNVNYRKNLK